MICSMSENINTHYKPANGKYFGGWSDLPGELQYIGPLEHYLIKKHGGDYEIHKTEPILNDWGELEYYDNGVMMRKYKLVMISYDKGISWKCLID